MAMLPARFAAGNPLHSPRAVRGQKGADMRTEGTEHGPAGVDDLDLAVSGEGLWVGGQTGSVPAVVT